MPSGIIFDIKRFAVNDGPGIRTTIFFKGCPLRCHWCHNPEGISKHPVASTKSITVDGNSYSVPYTIGRKISPANLLDEILKDSIFMEESGGGVTFSGGEPLIQPAFLKETLALCRQHGIHTAVDTSGYASWNAIEPILEYTNLFLFDIKCISHALHLKRTGVSNKLILENLNRISAHGGNIHIRIPVIPGFNSNIHEMLQILETIKGLTHVDRVDLLPFHKIASTKYSRLNMADKMQHEAALYPEDLEPFKTVFENNGLRVSIGG